tara:strand:- start:201 stop:737 length:537 start_codon:yes stop_codon:yes gene_type:complete
LNHFDSIAWRNKPQCIDDLMKRFLVLALSAGLFSPLSALSEEKYFQCPEGSEQNCIDLIVAYGACAQMKFKNDGEGDNAFNLSLRFVDTLWADTGLKPTIKQLRSSKDKKRREKRLKHFDSICSSELDKYALKKYQSETNKERKYPRTLSTTKLFEKFLAVTTYGETLGWIMKQIENQ